MVDQQYPGSMPGWGNSDYQADSGALGAFPPQPEPSFPTPFSATAPASFGGPRGEEGDEETFPPRHDTALWKILVAIYIVIVLAIAGGLSFYFNKLDAKVAASEAVIEDQIVNPSTKDPKSPTFALKEWHGALLETDYILEEIYSGSAKAKYTAVRSWIDPSTAPLDGDIDIRTDGLLGVALMGMETPEASQEVISIIQDGKGPWTANTDTGIPGAQAVTTSERGIVVWAHEDIVVMAICSAQGKVTNQKLIALAQLQYEHMNKGKEPTTTNLAQ